MIDKPLTAENDRVAMILCPAWSNLPPISLAYIKGAVKTVTVDCFDFNHKLLKCTHKNYRELFVDVEFPHLSQFMSTTPDFKRFEAACVSFAEYYGEFLMDCLEDLSDYGTMGLSVNQENIVASTVLARMLKKNQDVIIIAGGPSVNMDKEVFTEYLLNDGTFDLAVYGIAEDVINGLLAKIISGGSISQIPGLAFLNSQNVIMRTRPKLNDMRVFSPPDYSDFDLDDYFIERSDWVSIYAVIGCRGVCEFCTIQEFYKKFKTKSIENIKKEILYLKDKHGSNKFFLSDGMFMGRKDTAMELFDFAIEHNIKLGIQIRMMSYWNDEELVRKAFECVFFLQIGFESGSPNVRKAMGKIVNQELNMSIFRLFLKYNIPLLTNIIIDYPNETDNDFQYTYDFLEEYFKAGSTAIGMNTFFIPNRFPIDKYGIEFEIDYHWKNDVIDIYDRFLRVQKIIRLGQSYGLPKSKIFRHNNVAGIPLQTSGIALKETQIIYETIRTVAVGNNRSTLPTLVKGWVESATLRDNRIRVSGWVPLNERSATQCLRVLANCSIKDAQLFTIKRPDVATLLNDDRYLWSGFTLILFLTYPLEKRIFMNLVAEDTSSGEEFVLNNSELLKNLWIKSVGRGH